jgi:phosphopantetheinyl transferase (holo-ACP synthase)
VSPFSDANAVVYSETTPVKSESATPRVVISKAAHTPMQSVGNTITISEDSPEALASALLSIAKAAA